MNSAAVSLLALPETRRSLEAYVRRRVGAPEVSDVVQTVLCEALASGSTPGDPIELKRWLAVIARHKIADLYRACARETLVDEPVGATEHDRLAEVRSLATWATQQRPPVADPHATLEWMWREAEGERFEE